MKLAKMILNEKKDVIKILPPVLTR